MEVAAIAAGALGEALAWRAVAGGRSVWVVLPATFAAMGAVAAAVRPPRASPGLDPLLAVAAGLAAGVTLYAATRVFVAAVRSWEGFAASTRAQYARAAAVPLGVALALSAVAVVGEELFWRGLVQPTLRTPLGDPGAALATWVGYVLVNLASGSPPIVAGAVVGGAVWTGLAWWSGGVAASLASHAVWTALMLMGPPVRVGAR